LLRILRVLAPNPDVYTLEGTNTWVVGEDPSIVIDPGPEIPRHLDDVARVAGRVGAVLVTHDHPDHAPGAAAFAAAARAPLYAFRLPGADHLRDGQVVRAGGLEITAMHTPGHSADHVVFHLVSEDALFTGDAVLGRGTSFIDPPEGDLVKYLRSLERMQELAPRTLYPGHGPIVMRAGAKLQEYLDHRTEREAQVLTVLSEGPEPISALVETIYVGYPPEVHPLAARSVLAHLLKLESEGRVARTGKGEDAIWGTVVPRECARCGRPVKGRARYCSTCSLVLLQEGSGTAQEFAAPGSAAEPAPESATESASEG
jgi:glyoxylase-like metal-dependent hydrolase (beta-lactamase superfamily II)